MNGKREKQARFQNKWCKLPKREEKPNPRKTKVSQRNLSKNIRDLLKREEVALQCKQREMETQR